MMSPEGKVYGGGGGREVRSDKSDNGCLTGGSNSLNAAALAWRRGMSVLVSKGRRGVGSNNTKPSEGTDGVSFARHT
jgi:hypothetical protein